MKLMTKTNLGFTILEISIVLIIISLLLGAINFGSSLVKNSQIMSVIGEISQYKSAINSFSQKYNAFPGDISNASTFWPNCASASGDTGNPSSCDGNGDGAIGCNMTNSSCSASYEASERLRAWQHMSLSSLINNNYSGFNTGASFVFGIDTPQSKYPSAGYVFYQDLCYNTKNHYLYLSSNNFSNILTPQDAFDIDRKFDDGNPITGSAIASSPDASINSSCSALASVACFSKSTTTYYIDNNSQICMLAFKY